MTEMARRKQFDLTIEGSGDVSGFATGVPIK